MKNKMLLLLATMAIGTSTAVLVAQEGPPPGENDRHGGKPPVPPIVTALDLNHDGVIDADEIAKASDSLKTLDKNGDGKLTLDELRPPRPEGFGGGEKGRGEGHRFHRDRDQNAPDKP
jgi:hypothetical protein